MARDLRESCARLSIASDVSEKETEVFRCGLSSSFKHEREVNLDIFSPRLVINPFSDISRNTEEVQLQGSLGLSKVKR